jgi:hypothetical protein
MLLLGVLDQHSYSSRSVTKSRDSSVGIVTGYKQDGRGIGVPRLFIPYPVFVADGLETH